VVRWDVGETIIVVQARTGAAPKIETSRQGIDFQRQRCEKMRAKASNIHP
jgi:hypothetical protein